MTVFDGIVLPRRNTEAGAIANNKLIGNGERVMVTTAGGKKRWKTGPGYFNDLDYDDEPENINGATVTGVAVLTGDAAAGRGALAAAAASDVTAISATVKKGDPWWDTVMAAPSETPTITVASSSQIGGGTTHAPTADYHYDPYFRYDGCSSVAANGPGVNTTYPEQVIPETVTDAQDIEFVFRAGRTGTGVIAIRLIVNGQLHSLPMVRTDATSGTVYYYKCHFAAAKVRHLKFQIDGATRFDGIVVGANTVCQRPVGPHRFRHTAIGDSLQQGGANYHVGAEESGDVFYFRYESQSYYQSVLMGCDSYINLGVGGSGWSDVSPADPFSNRIALALAGYPHVLGFYGSRNDFGRESQVTPAVIAALGQVTDVPMVIVCGPQQAGFTALNELVRQGVVAAGRTWMNVDGVAASPASNPTGHPTILEQQALAKAGHAQLDMQKTVSRVEGVAAAKQPVTVSVSPSPASPVYTSTSVTFTATVTSMTSPTGKVQFYDNGVALGSPVTVSSGTAAYTTSALSNASHAITARFLPTNPQAMKFGTSAPITFVVAPNLGVAENFNRADSSTLGSTQNGKPWTVVGANWVIASNQLANTSPGAGQFAHVDPGAAIGVYEWTMGGTYSTGARLCMFFGDSANYLFLNTNGGSNNWRLWSRIANSTATVATGSASASWVATDVIRVEVTAGTTSSKFNIVVKKNGTIITGLNLTDVDLGVLATNTRLAFYLDSSAASATLDAVNMTV